MKKKEKNPKASRDEEEEVSLANSQKVGELGHGSFGVVNECIALKSGVSFAIKEIDRTKLKDDVFAIRREIRMHTKSRHNNIVDFYFFFHTENTVYLVLEKMDYSLKDHLKVQKKLSEDSTSSIGLQVFTGLQFLHSNKTCHRDIKSDNLLMRGDLVKISDLGLASDDILRTFCGTKTHAAPEFYNKTVMTCAVDQWAFGVVLFECLVGAFSFSKEDVMTISKAKKDHFEPPNVFAEDGGVFLKKFLKRKQSEPLSATEALETKWIIDGEKRRQEKRVQEIKDLIR